MSTYLETLDIPLKNLDELTHQDLQKYDLIVVGNSVPRNSEHAKFVEQAGVSFTSFPSFLGEFILKEREVIGLAGTHGKTTSTYFLAQMLENLGEEAGYFVGGIIDGRPPSRLGKSKYFIIESDEYDSAYFQKISKFRLYKLNHMILTSLEYDHADIFESIEDIKKEFAAIIPHLSGCIVANDDYTAIKELEQEFPQKEWKYYGTKTPTGPSHIKSNEKLSSFHLELDGKDYLFETNVVGVHNILNISACIKVLFEVGFTVEKLQQSVKHLAMVKRRQEVRGFYHHSLVIDDFAHHPKAITLTLDALKAKYPHKKLVTVFEPISATARSSVFQKEFARSLQKSPQVIIAVNPLKTTVEKSKNLDTQQLVNDLNSSGVEAKEIFDVDTLMSQLKDWSGEDKLIAVLSNRTCIGLWESKFVQELI
jgi:UDP-N-acetylmuramate: L-alanyl-gamma-D-glutamyl-meso-diaminopimelate ligase